jgi:hypothetical protein
VKSFFKRPGQKVTLGPCWWCFNTLIKGTTEISVDERGEKQLVHAGCLPKHQKQVAIERRRVADHLQS